MKQIITKIKGFLFWSIDVVAVGLPGFFSYFMIDEADHLVLGLGIWSSVIGILMLAGVLKLKERWDTKRDGITITIDRKSPKHMSVTLKAKDAEHFEMITKRLLELTDEMPPMQ